MLFMLNFKYFLTFDIGIYFPWSFPNIENKK